MKRLLLLAALLACVVGAAAQDYLPRWQKGMFDIHFIATGRGDACFVVMPDGTTMLVDAGDLGPHWHVAQPNPSLRPGEWIAKYIHDFSEGLPHRDTVDYFYLTHYHTDHAGSLGIARPGPHGYPLAGITEVGEKIHFNTIVDRECGEYRYPSEAYFERKVQQFFRDAYFPFCRYQRDSCGTVLEKFVIGSRRQFRPRHDTKSFRRNFEVYNLAANAHIHTGKGLKTRPMSDENPLLFDENMFSGVILFRYGKFSFYNGGDLPGGRWTYTDERPHNRDFESPVADLIGGHVTMIKPDHHGWKDSSNGYFLKKLSPDLIVLMCSSTGHPYKKTMERMLDPMTYNTPRKFYTTTDGSRRKLGEELFSHFEPWRGHIVVRVYEGGDSYQVFVLDAASGHYELLHEGERVKL